MSPAPAAMKSASSAPRASSGASPRKSVIHGISENQNVSPPARPTRNPPRNDLPRSAASMPRDPDEREDPDVRRREGLGEHDARRRRDEDRRQQRDPVRGQDGARAWSCAGPTARPAGHVARRPHVNRHWSRPRRRAGCGRPRRAPSSSPCRSRPGRRWSSRSMVCLVHRTKSPAARSASRSTRSSAAPLAHRDMATARPADGGVEPASRLLRSTSSSSAPDRR